MALSSGTVALRPYVFLSSPRLPLTAVRALGSPMRCSLPRSLGSPSRRKRALSALAYPSVVSVPEPTHRPGRRVARGTLLVVLLDGHRPAGVRGTAGFWGSFLSTPRRRLLGGS
jgi:hypothetical protein